MKKQLIFLGLLISLSTLSAFMYVLPQQEEEEEKLEVCVSPEEMKLYNLLNEYRKTKGLPAIPLSKSLTYVAQSHVKDLEINQPATGSCNMHSWSDDGDWSACCYTPDHAQAKCMWDKPKELTNYTGAGFEISYGGFGAYEATAEGAMKSWKGSNGHNSVMINQGIWKKWDWSAVGVGIFGSYGVIWFGKPKDTAVGEPKTCE